MSLIGWVFMPTVEDVTSENQGSDTCYNPQIGDVLLKDSADTPMNDSMYKPGWKRAAWLDQP